MSRLRKMTALLIVISQAASAAWGNPDINKKNWRGDPRIKMIRKLYENIESRISAGKLTITKHEYEYCEPYEDVSRIAYKEFSGRILKYVKSGGSDDSMRTISFYYDARGKLRFAFVEAGALNESRLEHRIYFSDDGKRLWEDHRYTSGPGYTFPKTWENEDLAFDPEKAFSAKNKCPEK